MTVTLITGANKGIGFETARQLIELGHVVYIGARDTERGEKAQLSWERTSRTSTSPTTPPSPAQSRRSPPPRDSSTCWYTTPKSWRPSMTARPR